MLSVALLVRRRSLSVAAVLLLVVVGLSAVAWLRRTIAGLRRWGAVAWLLAVALLRVVWVRRTLAVRATAVGLLRAVALRCGRWVGSSL